MINKEIILSQAESAAKHARKVSLRITAETKSSHIASCFSVIDILSTLFSRKLNFVETNGDEIILSKGHAAAALYSVLDYFNLLNTSIDTYCSPDSLIYGHVNHHASKHIPLSTGSLGHGLPFGVGIALANKIKGNESKTYIIISDGELNEGTTWESALFASHHKLNNLILIVDRNRIQSLGFTEDIITLESVSKKWESFNWLVREIDGHDYRQIFSSLENETDKPLCIIANTTKGRGVSFMENTIEWHYKSASESELRAGLIEIDEGLK
jgi:transketolase